MHVGNIAPRSLEWGKCDRKVGEKFWVIANLIVYCRPSLGHSRFLRQKKFPIFILGF